MYQFYSPLAVSAVGESTALEILDTLQRPDASTNHPGTLPQVDNAPETNGASHCAQQNDGAKSGLVKQNAEADRPQQDSTRHQQDSVQGASNSQLKESSVTMESIRGTGPDITGFMEEATPRVAGQFAPDNIKNHQVTGSKRSLMERNPTASTYEVISLCFCCTGDGKETILPRLCILDVVILSRSPSTCLASSLVCYDHG